MARWSGKIGFSDGEEETAPSVFCEKITERQYYGDVLDFGRQTQSSDQINDDIQVGNQLSIVCDPYATANLYNMRYATFMGQKWKVSSVKVTYPRLTLTLGGLWHGNSET